MPVTRQLLTILYVQDLAKARSLYDVFGWSTTVDEHNYLEYQVTDGARLGLMPQANTVGFLGAQLGAAKPTDGCPRAEIYIFVDDAAEHSRELEMLGAVCISPLATREWGDRAAYFLDPDGYVVVVADQQIDQAKD